MPNLLGANPKERAQVNQLAGVINTFRWNIMYACYNFKGKSPYNDDIEKEIAEKMPAIYKSLGNKKFLVGDKPTWIDIYFLEVLNLINAA